MRRIRDDTTTTTTTKNRDKLFISMINAFGTFPCDALCLMNTQENMIHFWVLLRSIYVNWICHLGAWIDTTCVCWLFVLITQEHVKWNYCLANYMQFESDTRLKSIRFKILSSFCSTGWYLMNIIHDFWAFIPLINHCWWACFIASLPDSLCFLFFCSSPFRLWIVNRGVARMIVDVLVALVTLIVLCPECNNK